MRERIVRETHWITHDDYPGWYWPMTVEVIYRVLDDGQCVVEIVPETIDYQTQGSC